MNFHAVELPLGCFDAPVILIAGGRGKGGDVAGFAGRIAPRIRHGFLIGETGPEMAEVFAARGVPHTVCASLDEAVRSARRRRAAPGDTVLLSPGFASFSTCSAATRTAASNSSRPCARLSLAAHPRTR